MAVPVYGPSADRDMDEEEDRLLNVEYFDGVERKRSLYEYRIRRRRAIILVSSIVGGLGALALILGLVYGLQGHKKHWLCPSGFESDDYDARFFVLGDWGRAANANQRRAASMMATLGVCYRPQFVVSTGDNFYDHGLKGPNDPYFRQTFTEVYNSDSLMVQWLSVLGNHDYGDTLSPWLLSTCSSNISFDACPPGCCYSAKWQTDMRSQDWRWQLQQGAWKRSFLNGKLDIIFIDTNPFISKYRSRPWATAVGGLSSQDTAAQLAQIHSLLGNSSAAWKLVVGHHPVRSFGEHCGETGLGGDCVDMQWLQPIMRQYQVSAYFCGHEHDLQLIKVEGDPVYYVVSGAGSDIREQEFNHADSSQLRFSADEQGFVAVVVRGDMLSLHFWAAGQKSPAHRLDIPTTH